MEETYDFHHKASRNVAAYSTMKEDKLTGLVLIGDKQKIGLI